MLSSVRERGEMSSPTGVFRALACLGGLVLMVLNGGEYLNGQAAVPPSPTTRAILNILEDLPLASFLSDPASEAEGRRDREVLVRLLSDDFIRVSPDGGFLNKAEVLSHSPLSDVPVSYERVTVLELGRDLTLAACIATVPGDTGMPKKPIASLFVRRQGIWQVIADEVEGPAMVSQAISIGQAGPTDSHDEREAAVRRAIEQYRRAVDPATQKAFGRTRDSQAVLASMTDSYVRVGSDLSIQTKQDLTRQFAAEDARGGAPGDTTHLWMNQPGASLKYENVNVRVLGNLAIVTWRSIINENYRVPKYSVLRVYEEHGSRWLMAAGVH